MVSPVKPVKYSEIIGLKPTEDVTGNMALMGNRAVVEVETHFSCSGFHRLLSKILWNVWREWECLVGSREYSAMSSLNQGGLGLEYLLNLLKYTFPYDSLVNIFVRMFGYIVVFRYSHCHVCFIIEWTYLQRHQPGQSSKSPVNNRGRNPKCPVGS